MNNQVRLFPDGQLVEYKADVPIRQVATHGNIQDLITALQFSRSLDFVISCDEVAPTDEILQARGGHHINHIGLKLLTTFEGCELEAYDDGVGVWTIGYGHTAGVAPGMRITQAEAEEFLRQDLELFESYVEDLVEVDLSADQFSALVCFCYNTGPGQAGFGGSTLLRLLNSGDFEGAAQQFPRWNKGDGKVMLGLTRRRLAEQALFRSQPWEFALTHDGNIATIATASTPATPPRSFQLTEPRMTGEDIRQFQIGLQNAGFDLAADGVFGSGTAAALREWQAREGWTVDGIAGPSLIAALT
ncbi:glycoside hydrolase family protein [filamentous cyanobacterium LEGE 11480]|uniref:Lysozyme n=1 Tax=Romeriopsis navalis LEGE 11480 TaxID=2777977 RepID=A0A928Z5L8_9CYAN|nr:glycoside hydrolase family protein [Romeriopsis navalis]MBE9032959.1 glycoside hydrolase family protein [Romeriopsis navalis LEGE 11480]